LGSQEEWNQQYRTRVHGLVSFRYIAALDIHNAILATAYSTVNRKPARPTQDIAKDERLSLRPAIRYTHRIGST
jgi:hypothetical protein